MRTDKEPRGRRHLVLVDGRASQVTPPRLGVAVLAVRGMSSPACAARVRDALLEHPAVLEAEVVPELGRARVTLAGGWVELGDLARLIERAGSASGRRYVVVRASSRLPRPDAGGGASRERSAWARAKGLNDAGA